jgi:antitoxin MazE
MQTISKWGNSLAVRIPAAFAESAGLAEGTEVDLKVQSGRLIVVPVRQHKYDLQELIGQITPENRHDLMDWGKPRGKEVW